MFLNKAEMNDNESRVNIKMHILFHLKTLICAVFIFPHPAFYSNKQKETFFFNLHILYE